MVWHRDRRFEIVIDPHRRKISCPVVLPQVPARSAMYRQLREFVASRQSRAVPEHRRIDPRKATVAVANRAGNVSLTVTARTGAFEYAVRKFVHLIQEIYLVFLVEHFDYQVEVFELDPDHP